MSIRFKEVLFYCDVELPTGEEGVGIVIADNSISLLKQGILLGQVLITGHTNINIEQKISHSENQSRLLQDGATFFTITFDDTITIVSPDMSAEISHLIRTVRAEREKMLAASGPPGPALAGSSPAPPLDVYVTTFNTNSKTPTDAIPSSWLSDLAAPDIVAISLQEFDLAAESFVRYTPYKEDEWTAFLDFKLGDGYTKVAFKSLVGVALFVYARHPERISGLNYSSLGTGYFGLATKSTVAARFEYHGGGCGSARLHEETCRSRDRSPGQAFHNRVSAGSGGSSTVGGSGVAKEGSIDVSERAPSSLKPELAALQADTVPEAGTHTNIPPADEQVADQGVDQNVEQGTDPCVDPREGEQNTDQLFDSQRDAELETPTHLSASDAQGTLTSTVKTSPRASISSAPTESVSSLTATEPRKSVASSVRPSTEGTYNGSRGSAYLAKPLSATGSGSVISLTFIASHLDAFVHKTEKRNQDFATLEKALVFENDMGIYDSDYTFWAGDLNYRLDLPRDETLWLVKEKDWESLTHYDQLGIQRAHRLAFHTFEEAPIAFAPTYKFDVGTSNYDSSQKQRTPSYTDRVLYCTRHPIAVTAYVAHMDVTISDHKPVSCEFVLLKPEGADLNDSTTYEDSEEDFTNTPAQISVHPTELAFPAPLAFASPQTATLTLSNDGATAFNWSFMNTNTAKPWVHVSERGRSLAPGEAVEVTVTCAADAIAAAELNSRGALTAEDLSDILVVSTPGRDVFVPIDINGYEPTCFGTTLGALVALRRPVREAGPEGLLAALNSPDTRSDVVPHELFRMFDFLISYGLDFEDLFLVPGDEALCCGICAALDSGAPFALDELAGEVKPMRDLSEVFQREVMRSISDLQPAEGDIDIGLASVNLREPSTDSLVISDSKLTTKTFANDATRISQEDQFERKKRGAHAMAQTLVRFLDSLTIPVVPYEYYSKALRVKDKNGAYALIKAFAGVNLTTLLYISAFLRIMIQQFPNKPTLKDRLALTFSSVLLKHKLGDMPHASADPNDAKIELASVPRLRKAFVLYFIE